MEKCQGENTFIQYSMFMPHYKVLPAGACHGLDADKFWQAVKVCDVSGSYRAAGHQVIENSTDVHHHIARGVLLVPIVRQLAHQVVHHL